MEEAEGEKREKGRRKDRKERRTRRGKREISSGRESPIKDSGRRRQKG